MKRDSLLAGKMERNVRALIGRLALVRRALLPAFLVLVVLSFLNLVPFYIFPLFVLLLVGWVLFLVYSHIECPNCGTSPFSRAGFRALPECRHCGLNLEDKPGDGVGDGAAPATGPTTDRYGKVEADGLDWSPLATRTGNFDTRKLSQQGDGRLVFRATEGLWLFGLAFVVFPLVIMTVVAPGLYPELQSLLAGKVSSGQFVLLFLLVPPFLVLMGLGVLYSATRTVVFDLSKGIFLGEGGVETLLVRVRALQLLSQRNLGKKQHYTGYQLNLVLHDGSRQNIVFYASRENAVRDSEKLASSLGIRLLNGIDRR